ncbi:hypothetical protein [Mesorhizobium sp. M0859]|uniref:hypothetical protein n=1 Tax=Mesorhizobium sp. M0859 TaxID=2957014 RepID=UPI00333A857F
MSIETAIAENTAAVLKLVAVTESLLSLRTEAFEKVGAAVTAAGKGTAAKDKPKADDKPKDNGNISTSPENRVNPYEGIKELIAGYITGTDRAEERDARKAKMRDLLNHEKIKKSDVAADAKPDASNIMESAIPLFKEQIVKLTAKGDITEAPKAPASDDLDL